MDDPMVQAMTWLFAAAAAAAFLFDRYGDRAGSAIAAIVACLIMVIGIVGIAVNDINGDVLSNCREIGGVQMVHVEGAWKCVTVEQAG